MYIDVNEKLILHYRWFSFGFIFLLTTYLWLKHIYEAYNVWFHLLCGDKKKSNADKFNFRFTLYKFLEYFNFYDFLTVRTYKFYSNSYFLNSNLVKNETFSPEIKINRGLDTVLILKMTTFQFYFYEYIFGIQRLHHYRLV